jgi:hypothetical protein
MSSTAVEVKSRDGIGEPAPSARKLRFAFGRTRDKQLAQTRRLLGAHSKGLGKQVS